MADWKMYAKTEDLKKPVAILVTPVLPSPKDSGLAKRSWGWLTTMVRKYRVHVLSLRNASDSNEIPENYPAERVWYMNVTVTTALRLLKVIGLMFPVASVWNRNLVTDWITLSSSAILWNQMKACLSRERVQRILVFRLYLHEVAMKLSQLFPDAIQDLDMDDHESQTRLSVARSLVRLGRYYEAIRQLSTSAQYWSIERSLCGPYRRVYLASLDDCQNFSSNLGGAICHHPNQVKFNHYFPSAPNTKELTLLFVGSLNYPPNEEAVRFIVLKIAPELERQLFCRWRIFIIGKRASNKVRELMKKCKQAEYIADAEDLARYYAVVHIVLVPLNFGGGTKIKTLEGFAHRRPVVSTAHGARGIGAISGIHYIRAESGRDFAFAIKRLHQNRALADRIAENGWGLGRAISETA